MVRILARYVMVSVALLVALVVSLDDSFAQVDINVGNKAGGDVHGNALELVVVIGASYAKGWVPGDLGGRRVINKGVSGERTHEMLARFDQDVIALGPRVVIIWGFINDIFRSPREELRVTLEQSRRNIAGMLSLARSTGIDPILATEITITAPDTWLERMAALLGGLTGKESYQDYVNRNVQEMNEWIRMFASAEGVAVLNFDRVLGGEDGRRRREYATEDGSHISPEGYDALTHYARNWDGWSRIR